MISSSRTLLAIAAIAAAPAAYGLDVTDADLKLGLTMQLQLRAEASYAESTSGAKYSTAQGSANPDTADFYVRRARIGFVGMYKEQYKFAAVLNADGADQKKAGDATDNRIVRPHQAFIGTSFPCMISESIKHYVQFGLDDAAYNGSQNIFSSRELLMPASRASGNLMKSRGVGVKWMMTAPNAQAWVDVQNNTGDDDGANSRDGDKGDGLWYSARLHLSPEGDLKIAKATESFLGADGKGVLLAIDGAINDSDASAGNTDMTTRGFGVELLGHFDGLTALAEFRAQEQSGNAAAQKDSLVYLAQAGYALPFGNMVLEPTARVTVIDLNKSNDDESVNYGSADYGSSGLQVEVGANLYISKHNNKIQLAYTNWNGEDADEAKADIVRVQWQLAF